MADSIEIIPLSDIPLIQPGDDLAPILGDALERFEKPFGNGKSEKSDLDVLVVAG